MKNKPIAKIKSLDKCGVNYKLSEGKSGEICIDTKKGIKYYFNAATKKVLIVLNKSVLVGATKRAQNKSIAKFGLSALFAMPISQIMHELAHAGVTILCDGEIVRFDTRRGLLSTVHSEFAPEVYSHATGVLFDITPFVLNAIVGLYLIQQGVKKRSPIRFGLGISASMWSLGEPIYALKDKTLDLAEFAPVARKAIVDYLHLQNPEMVQMVSHISDPLMILIIAAFIYGVAFYGTRYVSSIEFEYLPRDLRNKLKKVLSKIAEKDPQLHDAIVNNFFSKKAKGWARVIIEKLPGLKRTLHE